MENQNQENQNQEIKKSTRGRPKTVNGVYDSKKYYQTFKNKNSDKIKEKVKCELCGGVYSYFNQSHHKSSIRHKNALLKTAEPKTDLNKELELIMIPKDNNNIEIVE